MNLNSRLLHLSARKISVTMEPLFECLRSKWTWWGMNKGKQFKIIVIDNNHGVTLPVLACAIYGRSFSSTCC